MPLTKTTLLEADDTGTGALALTAGALCHGFAVMTGFWKLPESPVVIKSCVVISPVRKLASAKQHHKA